MWSKKAKPLSTHADAYNYCLDRLALRDHSSLELKKKLTERQCPEELQSQVLAKLAEHHFVDDERCAGYVLDAWRRKKYYGKQYLRLMLQKRMIPRQMAGEILSDVTEEEEGERAEVFARSILSKLHRKYPDDRRKGKAALARMLASRGFGSGAVAGCLFLWDEEADE